MKFDQLVFLVFFVMVMKECYGCEGPLGMESKAIKDSQITASSHLDPKYVPSYARLNMKDVPGENGGGWSASFSAPHWLQIDLGAVKKVTAIATQGLSESYFDQWIKTYQVLYGNDPNSLTLYDNGRIFNGNTDRHSIVKNIFNPPIQARYIRVLMKSWQLHPVMRMELYGCAAECKAPLGMENMEIKDSQITASSHFGPHYVPSNARLHMKSVQGENGGAWAAGTSTGPHWVHIDLGSNKKITAIATQGHPDKKQWIYKYQILSKKDGESSVFSYGNGEPLTGNIDNISVVKNMLDPPIEARYILVYMNSWQWWPAMRIELYGCAAE